MDTCVLDRLAPSILILLASIVSLLVAIIPSVMTSIAGRCLCRPTCASSVQALLCCAGGTPCWTLSRPETTLQLASLSRGEALGCGWDGSLHAACLLLLPGLGVARGIICLFLHALGLLSGCLLGFKHRKPSIVFKELAALGEFSHVGLCSDQAIRVKACNRTEESAFLTSQRESTLTGGEAKPLADALLFSLPSLRMEMQFVVLLDAHSIHSQSSLRLVFATSALYL